MSLIIQIISQFIKASQPYLMYLVPLAAIAQLLASINGAGQDFPRGAESPAGYAFAIWSPLFVLGTAFAIYQVGRRDAWLDRVRPFAFTAMMCSAAWMYVAQTKGPVPLTILIIIAMLVASLVGRIYAVELPEDKAHHKRNVTMVRGTQIWLGAQAGWLTLAALLNMTSYLRAAHSPLPAAETLHMAPLVSGAFVVMVLFFGLKGSVSYIAAVIWGLVAVAVANYTVTNLPEMTEPNWSVVIGALWFAAICAIALILQRGARGRFVT